MNKGILSLTAAAVLFCAPAFADDTMSSPSSSTASTDTTTLGSTTSNVPLQLKTSDGKMLTVQISPSDMQGLKEGDLLTIGPMSSTSSTPAPSTTPDASTGGANSTDDTE